MRRFRCRHSSRLATRAALWVVPAVVSAVLVGGAASGRLIAPDDAAGSWASLLATAVLAAGAASLALRRVTEPWSRLLADLGRGLEAAARGDRPDPLPEARDDELGQLACQFARVAEDLGAPARRSRDQAGQLRAALENLRKLDQAKDEFLVLVSHEVRTPLTAIMGGSDLLAAAVRRAREDPATGLDPDQLAQVAATIAHSGERLNGFLTDVIQMTAIQCEDKPLKLQALSAGELLRPSLERRRHDPRCGHVRLEDRLSDRRDWALLCDPGILRLALDRILDNAFLHNRPDGLVRLAEVGDVPGLGPAAGLVDPAGAARLQAALEHDGRPPQSVTWRLLEIYNTGPEIPADRQEALFAKFQLVGRITHHQQGSGLSLPIAKCAVEHHGGSVHLVGHEGSGNSFYLLLPTVPATAPRGAVPSCWDDQGERLRGVAGNEEIRQVGDGAALEVELDDRGAAATGLLHQPGGGMDGAGGAHDQEEVAVGDRGR